MPEDALPPDFDDESPNNSDWDDFEEFDDSPEEAIVGNTRYLVEALFETKEWGYEEMNIVCEFITTFIETQQFEPAEILARQLVITTSRFRNEWGYRAKLTLATILAHRNKFKEAEKHATDVYKIASNEGLFIGTTQLMRETFETVFSLQGKPERISEWKDRLQACVNDAMAREAINRCIEEYEGELPIFFDKTDDDEMDDDKIEENERREEEFYENYTMERDRKRNELLESGLVTEEDLDNPLRGMSDETCDTMFAAFSQVTTFDRQFISSMTYFVDAFLSKNRLEQAEIISRKALEGAQKEKRASEADTRCFVLTQFAEILIKKKEFAEIEELLKNEYALADHEAWSTENCMQIAEMLVKLYEAQEGKEADAKYWKDIVGTLVAVDERDFRKLIEDLRRKSEENREEDNDD